MEIVQVKTYILLGSNLGDRKQLLESAEELIAARAGKIQCRSAIYETEAWGMQNASSFLNRVLEVHTTLAPEALLNKLLSIEQALGRTRNAEPDAGYQSRTIDIDILYYGDHILNADNLTIPHPRISERRFVLAPLVEICPSFLHPIYKVNQRTLQAQTTDPMEVTLYHE